MTRYRARLQCPSCGKDGGLIDYDAGAMPVLNCGDCLMDKIEVVELIAVSVREIAPCK